MVEERAGVCVRACAAADVRAQTQTHKSPCLLAWRDTVGKAVVSVS